MKLRKVTSKSPTQQDAVEGMVWARKHTRIGFELTPVDQVKPSAYAEWSKWEGSAGKDGKP